MRKPLPIDVCACELASSSLITQYDLLKDISSDVRLYVCLIENGWMDLVWTLCHLLTIKNRSYLFPVCGNTSETDSKVTR
jgi:hypothetical protein